eukprot:COSAG05_NODE_323_length_11408_cov_361.826156_15_plen_82_part_00
MIVNCEEKETTIGSRPDLQVLVVHIRAQVVKIEINKPNRPRCNRHRGHNPLPAAAAAALPAAKASGMVTPFAIVCARRSGG